MRKLFLCLFTGLSFLTASAQVQVDLSTGATAGSPLAVGSNDDTWTTVQLPNSTWVTPIVSNGTLWSGAIAYPDTWDEADCGQWISPWTITTPGATFGMIPSAGSAAGNYRYRMTFNIPCLSPGGAFIQLNWAGADNTLTQVVVNSNVHNVSATFSPLSTINIPLGAAELNTGANTIEVVVNNLNRYTGLFLCGFLQYDEPRDPSIRLSADDKLCAGDQVTATAVTTSGTVINHQWNLYESDVNGNYISGGYNWFSGSMAGAPNYSYLFPGSTSLPCNRYYTIRLIASNGCQSFVYKVTIYIACNNPAFSISNNVANPGYYTMSATPVDLAPYGPVGGFGYAWFVEELDPFNNPLYTISNPPIWWTFTANYVGYINNFQGFDGSLSYSGTVTTLPVNPTLGKFLYNKTYRITRGTWVRDYCEWKQFSQTIRVSNKPGNRGPSDGYDVIVTNANAPDMSGIFTGAGKNTAVLDNNAGIQLYPNPAGNTCNIEFRSAHAYQADWAVQDVSGRIVLKGSFKVNEGANLQQIATDRLSEGIYLLRVDGITEVKRLMIQR